MSAAGGQSKFLEARQIQLIVDLYLADKLDPPEVLLDQPFSQMRMQLLIRKLDARSTGALLQSQQATVTALLSSLMPNVASNDRIRVVNERQDAARRAWFVTQGSRSAIATVQQKDVGDILSLWQKLVATGHASGQL